VNPFLVNARLSYEVRNRIRITSFLAVENMFDQNDERNAGFAES
jgi:hypothetical protein